MNTAEAQKLTIERLKKEFYLYLERQNYARNTKNTISNDAFYLWRRGGKKLFWSVITSLDFNKKARKELCALLEQNSEGNVKQNLNGYVNALRRFHEFVIDIKSPCKEELLCYFDKWMGLTKYQNQEKAIDQLFSSYPKNSRIEDVLLKSTVLNDFYSTQIFDIYPVAEKIIALKIDIRLREGDLALVDEISKIRHSNNKVIEHISFASKYCSHHRPDVYPIYDFYVNKILCYFRRKDHFYPFKEEQLKQYTVFHNVIEAFRKYYGLEEYGLKLVDKYLWLLGKEYFPRKYKSDSDE